MSINKKTFPKVSRPGEYIGFFVMQAKTKEGFAYMYLACDAYSEYGFFLGSELNDNPETILKHINLLMVDKEFVRLRNKGFTLVFDYFQELSDQIESIIKPFNGHLLFDTDFHLQIVNTMRTSFSQMRP